MSGGVISTAFETPPRAVMSATNNGPQSSPPAAMRSANDIRLKEASPDVINNLLASLSSISLPADPDHYSPLIPDRTASIPSPAPSSPSRSSSRRPSAPTSIFSQERSLSLNRHQPATASSIGEVSITHVAQPPTVKTSRPPSGYSKLTAPKPRKLKTVQSLRSSFTSSSSPSTTAPPSRQQAESPLPQLAEEPIPSKAIKSKKSIDETRRARALSIKSQRDSVQLTHWRESKGKQRAGLVSSPTSPDIPTPELYSPLAPHTSLFPPSPYSRSRSPSSRRIYLSEKVSPAPRSPVGPPATQDHFYTPTTSSRSLNAEGSTDNFVIIHRKKKEASSSLQERRKFIPSRSSSVGRTSGSPPLFGHTSRRSSQRSSLRSQFPSPDIVPEERIEEEQAVGVGQEVIDDSGEREVKPSSPDLGLGEENTVIKRIKQLRAAKKERDKAVAESMKQKSESASFRSSTQTSSLSRLKRPDTSKAAVQVEQATTLRERRLAAKPNAKLFKLEPPPISPVLSPSPTRANFSRLRPNDPNGMPLSSPASLAQNTSGDSTNQTSSAILSRSASKIKRWSNPSNPDLAAARKSHQRHSRNNSNKTEKAAATQEPAIEEQRSSSDSVNDSVRGFLESSRLSQRITPPGETRIISFSEVGDLRGHAVFCCVGMGLTRFVMAFYEELALTLKLRLITIERPGIGDSTPYLESRSPLHWPDDIRAVCNYLSIQSFSLVAHSAGAIYALATALKMPSRVRGRIQLLSPWIPPSQLSNSIASCSPVGPPAKFSGLPKSQRFLRYVPTPFLKLGSASYLATNGKPVSPKPVSSRKGSLPSTTSTTPSITTSPRPSMSPKGFSNAPSILAVPLSTRTSIDTRSGTHSKPPSTPHLEDMVAVPSDHSITAAVLSAGSDWTSTLNKTSRPSNATSLDDAVAWQKRYDAQLTATTWELATRNANPAVDLLICLERNGSIGFSYRDIARAVVIRHGSKDSRVPIENVKWLGTQVLRKAEVRILEGQGHGLMANAGVMASVLSEIGKEAEMGKDYGSLGSRSTFNSPVLETSNATF